MGVRIEGALEIALSKHQSEEEPEHTTDLNNFIYVPSIGLYFSGERTLQGKTWDQAHEELRKQGCRMPLIPEFEGFLEYVKTNNPDIYEDITGSGDWRGEWLDAYFEQKNDGFYILTHNKSKAEKLENCLMNIQLRIVSIDDTPPGRTNSRPRSRNAA